MNVECPSCATSFPVDPKKVPVGGVHARCSVCDEVFFVEDPALEVDAAPVEAQAEAPVEEALDAAVGVEEEAVGVEEEAEVVEEEVSEPVDDLPAEGPTFGQADPALSETPFGEPEGEADLPELAVEEEATTSGEEDEAAVVETDSIFETITPSIEEDEPAPAFGEAEPTFAEPKPTFGEPETIFPEPETPSSEAETTAVEPETTFDTESTEVIPEAPAPVEEEAPEPVSLPAPQFGKRDPKDKAQRLARVLVSDIILYNPDRHQRALDENRIKEEFEDEVRKSWDEYIEQVGDEIATSTNFFNEALNEILAKGQQLF